MAFRMEIVRILLMITTIQICEANLSVTLTSTTNTITVSWQAQTSHGIVNFNVTYKDGTSEIQTLGPYNGSLLDTVGTIPINGLASGKQYTIEIQSSGVTKYTGSKHTKPNPPTSFTVAASTANPTTELELTWTAGSDSTSFTVRDQLTNLEKGLTGTSHTLTTLAPGKLYTLTIVAVSGGEESVPPLASAPATISTNPLPPTNLKVHTSKTTTTSAIYLEWTPGSGSVQSSYKVTVLRVDGSAVSTVPSVTIVTSVTGTSADITGLTGGVDYKFLVVAVSNGKDSESSNVTEATLPTPTASFITSSPTVNSMKLTWTHGAGERSKYVITYTPSSGSAVTLDLVGTSTEVVIGGLIPSTDYTFTIKAVSNNLDSQNTTATGITSALDKVAGLSAVSATEISILVTWTTPTGTFDKYRITYTDKTAPGSPVSKNFSKTATQYDVTGLIAGHKYEITIALMLGSTVGQQSDILYNNTVPNQPKDVSVTALSITDLQIGWTTVSLAGLRYEVYFEPNTGSGSQTKSSCTSSGCTITMPSDIVPGSAVKISVFAVVDSRSSAAGLGMGNTKPNAPGIPTINTRTKSKLVLYSARPSNTIIEGWLIKVEPSQGIFTSTHDSPNGLYRVFTIDNLSPGYSYTVSISTKSGQAESASVKAIFTTKPPPPKTITETVAERGTTSLTVTWSKVTDAKGNFEEYIASITEINANSYANHPAVAKNGTLQAVFTGLTAGNEYMVKVITRVKKNGTNEKISSGDKTVTFRTKPNKIPSIIIDENQRTTSRLAFTWPRPADTWNAYNVKLNGENQQQRTSGDISYSSLNAGTEYTIEVIVQAGENSSPTKTTSTSKTLSAFTKPNAPTVDSIVSTVDTITVTWSSSGEFKAYKIGLYASDCSTVVRAMETVAKPSVNTRPSHTYNTVQPGTIYCVKLLTTVGVNINSEVVKQKTTTKPKPPITLTIPSKDTTSLTINWIKPNQSAQVDGYRVELMKGATSVKETFQTATSLYHTGLTPGETYNIKISAYKNNHNAVPQKLFSTEQLTKTVTMIPNQPQSLSVSQRGATYLTIVWGIPTISSGTMVYWKLAGTKDHLSEKEISGTIDTTTIDNLGIGKTYEIQVKIKSGTELSSAITEQSTTLPTGTAVNLVEPINTKSIQVQWNAPTNTFDSYELTINPNDGQETVPLMFAKDAMLEKVFKGLTPGRKYILTITVISGNARQSNSRPLTTKPLPVTDLSAKILSTSVIEVSWKPGQLSEQNNFEVKYRVKGAIEKSITKNHVAGDMTTQTVQIPDLTPGETYQISVHAVSNSVPGDAQSTTQNTKPATVKSLEATAHGTKTVKLIWTVDTNGIQKGFKLRYKGNAQLSYQTHQPVLEGTERTATVQGLFPGDEYIFELTAYSGAKDTKSDSKTANAVLEPLNPTPTWEKSEATVTSATFSWTYDTTKYYAEKFSLKMFKKGSTTVVKEQMVEKTVLKHTFTSLTSGEKYTFKIFTLTYGNKNNTSPGTVDATVRPEITSRLNESSTTDTKVIITYTATTTIFDKYIFSINDAKGTMLEKTSSDVNKVSFTGLTPGFLYTVSAKTKSGELLSQPKDLSVLTNPRPPRLSCSEEPDVITLTISAPLEGADKAAYTYITNCAKCPNGDRIGTAGKKIFSRLEPFQQFIFSSRTKFDKVSGQVTFSKESPETVITCQTKEAPPGPIVDFNVTDILPYKATLWWSEPTKSNGLILGYWLIYSWVKKSGEGQQGERAIEFKQNSTTFKYVVQNLYAGHEYTFQVISYNSAGNSTTADRIRQIPFGKPFIPDTVTMEERKPKSGFVKHNTAVITFKNVFSAKNGTVKAYTLYALPNNEYSSDILRDAGTWAKQIDVNPQGAYIIFDECTNFFESGGTCAAGRNKRQTFSAPLSDTTVTIGSNEKCDKRDLNRHCNGPLRPETSYSFLLRAFNENGDFTDLPPSDMVKTTPQPNDFPVLEIVLAIIIAAVVFLVIIVVVCLKRRGVCGGKHKNDPHGPFRQGGSLRLSQNKRYTAEISKSDGLQAFEVKDIKHPERRMFVCGNGKRLSKTNANLVPVGFRVNRSMLQQKFSITSPHHLKTRSDRYLGNATAPLNILMIVLGVVLSCILVLAILLGILLVWWLRRRGYICNTDTKPVYPKASTINRKDPLQFSMKGVSTNRPIKVSDFPAHVDNMSKDSDFLFAEEYEELKPVGRGQTLEHSELPVNRPRNRFNNILPYDHSRVKLLPSEDEEGSDYINANWMPGYNSKREFICTQGPLPSTTDDFWRMVWEQNCRAIVMLTKCVEKGREKCHHYWPIDTEPMFYGDLQVEIRNESKTQEYVVTEFQISKGNTTRRLTHFHYTAWPDFGVPEKPQSLLGFIRLVRTRVPHHDGGPIIVHCSAGVGRSGTFIVLDRLIQQIENSKDEPIDVYGILFEMRKYRVWMVQTEQQYICIHKCLKHVIEGSEYDNVGMANPGYDDYLSVGYYSPETGARLANMFPNQLTASDTESQLEDEGIAVNGR